MVTADLNRAGDRLAGSLMDDPVALAGGALSLGLGLVISETVVDWAVTNFSPSQIGSGPFVDAGAAALLGVGLVAAGNYAGGPVEPYLSVAAVGVFAWAGMRALQGAGVDQWVTDLMNSLTGGGSSAAPARLTSARNGRSLPSASASPSRVTSRRTSGTTYR